MAGGVRGGKQEVRLQKYGREQHKSCRAYTSRACSLNEKKGSEERNNMD